MDGPPQLAAAHRDRGHFLGEGLDSEGVEVPIVADLRVDDDFTAPPIEKSR